MWLETGSRHCLDDSYDMGKANLHPVNDLSHIITLRHYTYGLLIHVDSS